MREIRNAQPNFGQNFDQDQKQNTGNASQSPDYLKDVDLGLETMLSTKEFKYYTYFNRIRRQLSQYWEPKVRDKLHKMFRQGRTIASNEDKITKLVIFLNPTGQLVKVQVMSESGIKDLDEAAIDAFRAAAPFPNPPQGIVDPDGFVKIRWDFVLEV
ncbi:MAG: TonB family protein [Bdellovibrionales bacterium]|nr:TonB family protein [Bdellovibrionales bacterium]